MFSLVGRIICCLCFVSFVEFALLLGTFGYQRDFNAALTNFLCLSLLVVPGSFYVAWRSTKNVP